jgi:tetratricopeptide (TPR) repeat protein
MHISRASSIRNIFVKALKWLLGLLLLAGIGAGIWWFLLMPPRVQRLYNHAREQYQAEDYAEALRTLEQAYRLNPRDVPINILLGWSHWQRREYQQAEFYFARAHRFDAANEEAKIGLGDSSLALQHAAVALPLFQELAERHPDDKRIGMSLAEAYVQSGKNYEAARTYRAMLARDSEDNDVRRELLEMYGYPEYRPDLPLSFPPRSRPATPAVYFRTHGDYFQSWTGKEWQNIYLVGVNIGPARPGEFPPTASRDFSTYFEWLQQIAAMNSNTVRAYTILPPAFYQALKAYNETAPAPLRLIQEVYLNENAEYLYDPKTEQEFRQELLYTIDLLHGQADVPYRRGHNYGIYSADVSRYVVGLGVGREVEPKLVLLSNRKNPSQTSYQGRYISLPRGNPSEVWFARMCDVAARYEIEKYNTEVPLTVVNWPPLDPMTHPSEGTYADELRIRKSLGEEITEVIEPDVVYNDMDVVSLDITKFRSAEDFSSGLFALYHVYQHWPDFLFHEPSYALARDREGPNRYLGYLQELRKAHPNFPLLIGEYGVSSSLGVSHIHPEGWNNGGLTEQEQAKLLVRFTRNIRDVGCAGGLVFEWQDEWFKHVGDLDTADFERPWERDPLWFNPMDPEKSFGLVGYEPVGPVPLLRGNPGDWQNAEQLSFPRAPNSQGPPGEIRALYAYSDFAYLYIRVDVEPGALDWKHWNYWIALNTLSGESGSRTLPEIQVPLESGANFLVQLTDPIHSRILVAEDYNPNEKISLPGRSGRTRMWRKKGMKVSLEETSHFVERITEANMARYAHDGRVFPAIDYNRSHLPYGTADRTSGQNSNHALWHVDADKGMIELRLPWGLLLLTDPSNLQVFTGTDPKRYTVVHDAWFPLSKPTPGITIAVFALYVPGPLLPKVVSSSLPPLGSTGKLVTPPPLYSWEKWDKVEYRPYFKPSYFALQKVFAEIRRSGVGVPRRPPLLH